MSSTAPPIVADRGEFIDALRHLSRGRVLVQVGADGERWGIDGCELYHSGPTLQRYGLVDEFDNPGGFAGMRYYRLSEAGRAFADRALSEWRRRPLWARLMTRLVG